MKVRLPFATYFLVLAMFPCIYAMFFASARASTNSGVDTPTGVITLPLAVEGVEGMTLVSQGAGGPVYVGVGSVQPQGNLDIENGSNTAKLCLNGACATSLPSSPVIFGGMFGEQSGACQFINPITGGCSCPSYAPNASHVLSANMGGGNQNGSIFFCYGTGG